MTAVLLLSACYRYAPAPSTAIAPGSHVRLGVLLDGHLTAVLGAETTGLEGKVLSESDSAWTISVAATLKRREPIAANRTVWAGEQVSVPRTSVNRVELRSLDRKKTTRAIALGVVGTVVLVRLLVAAGGLWSGDGDGDPVVIPP